MKHTFPKSEKLCGKKSIAALYQAGRKFTAWPLRVTWQPTTDATRVLIWAPKSLFRHAVQRNLLRRRIREAWRLNSVQMKQGCDIAFNYIDKAVQPYSLIEKSVKKAIRRIQNEQSKGTGHG
ncbi:MAG: ribonuclease P protein component [Paludibacteraceae bacterium]|nr:ribonuclease P protein component [Paludibacteraceae bacterium]